MVLQRGFDLPVKKRKQGDFPLVASNGIIDCHSESRVQGPGVITGRSGTLGMVHYVEKDFWPLNTTLYLKEMYDNNPKYLYYFLQNLNIARFGTGTGVPTLNRNYVHKINIVRPPIPEQQKIAEILTTIDDKIASIEDRIQQTEQLKKGLMEKLLTEGIGHTEFKDTKIGRIPVGWDNKTLNEVSYGTQNGLYKSKSYYGSGYEMVHMPDVFANEQIVEGGMKKVNVSDAEIEKYKLLEGDLVFARRSLVPEGSGKCCYVGKINSCITFESSMIRVSLKQDILHSKFAYYYISSFIGRREMMKYVRQVAVSGISGKDLQKYNLPVPPIPEQKQIASILSTVDDKLDVLHTKKANYETLKKGLMEQLLTGKMRVKP
jgi:type I restriction enzyme S subunit